MGKLLIALIIIIVLIIGRFIYKRYINKEGQSCSVNSDCSANQYCGKISKVCLTSGTCVASATGKIDDCGTTGTCISGKCQLNKGYCNSIGPLTGKNVSNCTNIPNGICVASTSQCMTFNPPASPSASSPSAGAPCTVAEDCAANDGWPNSKITPNLPCNYFCDLSQKQTNTIGSLTTTYGTCAASTCCTTNSDCPGNYPKTNTQCDTKTGICILSTSPAERLAAKQQAAKK